MALKWKTLKKLAYALEWPIILNPLVRSHFGLFVFNDPDGMASMVDMSIQNNIERRKLSYFSQANGNLIDVC